MTTTLVHLPSLAHRINEEHDACQRVYQDTLAHAFEAGRLLLEAKESVEHGEWSAWLRENVACSERTAQVYMQLASAPQLEEPQTSAVLSIAQALKSVSKPKPKEAPVDVAAALRGLGSADDSLPGRVDEARDRLRAGAAVTWSGQQQRKRQHAASFLDVAVASIAEASADGLSPFSVCELLREAAIAARRGAVALEELAFTFEQ
jgi:hypothetical protein